MKTFLLYTKDKAQALQEIEKKEGKVSQEFSDDLFVALLPEDFNEETLSFSSTKSHACPARYHAWR